MIDRHGGRVVKSTGDGLLAVFDVPSQGVACGINLCEGLAGIGVPIRTGVHAGEIEIHDDDGDISGIAVNLAARVEQHARDLKGIDGSWRLFSVA